MQNNVSMKRGLSLGTGPDFYTGDIILSVERNDASTDFGKNHIIAKDDGVR